MSGRTPIVAVRLWGAPGEIVVLDWAREMFSPVSALAVSDIVPVKLFTLFTVTVDVAYLPCWTVRDEGVATMMKSGGGVVETVTVFDAVALWLRESVTFRKTV